MGVCIYTYVHDSCVLMPGEVLWYNALVKMNGNVREGYKTRTGTRDYECRIRNWAPLYLFLNPSMPALLLLDLSSILANSSSQSRTWSNEIGWKMM